MRRSFIALALLALALAPATVFAQTNSTITGEVTDNTGGILPGVTVEASSPVLIEGSRVGITDGAGRYTLINLRPGVYNLSFTLPGFSTVVVEEQALPAGVTVAVNAELSVGALEETVTVSGEAPVVDVQTTRQVEVLSTEVLDAIPTGRNMQSTASLIVGIKLNRPEVGLSTASQQTVMFTHGMSWRQVSVAVDGQLVNGTDRDGGIQNYHNELATQEMVYETSGMTAEVSGGGVRINMIPREGGNTFNGQFYTGYSQKNLAGDHASIPSSIATHPDGSNRTTSTEGNNLFFDINAAQGGPIVRDKFWFFGSTRHWQVDKPITGSFYRVPVAYDTPLEELRMTGMYPYQSGATTPDGRVPDFFQHDPEEFDGQGYPTVSGLDTNTISSALLRLTYQANQSNKFAAYLDRIWKNRFHPHGGRTDVATAPYHQGSPMYYTGSFKWTSTISNRLLLEAGYSSNVENWSSEPRKDGPPEGPAVPASLVGITAGLSTNSFQPANIPQCLQTPCYEWGNYMNAADVFMMQGAGGVINPWYEITRRRDLKTGYVDRAHWSDIHETPERFNYLASLSYVTGSHNFKVGMMNSFGDHTRHHTVNGALWDQRYEEGVPKFAGVSNLPIYRPIDFQQDMALYAQDTWTVDRLTLNLGLRYEIHRGRNEPAANGNSRFVDERNYGGATNIPNWNDAAPRFGLAYDVFGDASTALKFTWGRYNASNTTSYARVLNPVTHLQQNRPWFDCALRPDGTDTCATRSELAGLLPAGVSPNTIMGDVDVWPVGGTEVQIANMGGGTNGDGHVQDWEIGAPTTGNFGQLSAVRIQRDAQGNPLSSGTSLQRPWVGLMNLGIEREIIRGLSLNFNWFRRDSYLPIILYNAARQGAVDWELVGNVANPCAQSHAGVSNSGPTGFPCSTKGVAPEQRIDVYNLLPDARGRSALNSMATSDINGDAYNGYEAGFNARLPNGTTIFGGWSMERNITNRCDQRDDANRLRFCDASMLSIPWLHDFKVSGTVPLPFGIQLSGAVQFYPPQEMPAGGPTDQFGGTNQGGSTFDDIVSYVGNVRYSLPASAFRGHDSFAPGGELGAMGVDGQPGLAGGMTMTRTVPITLALMPPGSLYADALTQIDFSIRKSFNLPNGMRWDIQGDIYNLPNLYPVTRINGTYGSAFGDATRSINRRFLQLATHLHW